MNIGIIGHGFVGKAVHNGFSHSVFNAKFLIYDPYVKEEDIVHFVDCYNIDETNIARTIDDFDSSDFIFVCLPTPTNFENGEQDLSIFYSVLRELNKCNPEALVVIKSTVRPGTTDELQREFSNLRIIFNPEFLTEANYLDDFLDQERIVIGGPDYLTRSLAGLYAEGWSAEIDMMSTKEAETVKYVANTFLATKVAFFNEIYKFCLTSGLDYGTVVRAVTRDERIGPWGTVVPGPDGLHGFGKKCFPKDIVTFIDSFKRCGVDSSLLQAVWKKNLEIREKKDWLDIKGASTDNLHGEEDE